MIIRDFWLNRLRRVWERVTIAWLAGVRRVGKTTLVRSLPEAECLYVNCDSPQAAQAVADPEFFFQQVKSPIVIFDEIHQLPDPTRLASGSIRISRGMCRSFLAWPNGPATWRSCKYYSGKVEAC